MYVGIYVGSCPYRETPAVIQFLFVLLQAISNHLCVHIYICTHLHAYTHKHRHIQTHMHNTRILLPISYLLYHGNATCSKKKVSVSVIKIVINFFSKY